MKPPAPWSDPARESSTARAIAIFVAAVLLASAISVAVSWRLFRPVLDQVPINTCKVDSALKMIGGLAGEILEAERQILEILDWVVAIPSENRHRIEALERKVELLGARDELHSRELARGAAR